MAAYRQFVLVLLSALLCRSSAWAACSSPTGSAGDFVYNTTYHVMQYCDGSNWIEMGRSINNGTADCVSPAGSPGDIAYNSDYNVMQYCNGADWVSMGTVPFASDPVNNLVARWKFDETSGTVARDSSGYGHNLTMYGGLDASTDSVAGQMGNALDFDATDDYASNAGIDLSGTDAVTVSGWFKRTYSSSGGHTLFELTSNFNSNSTGFGFFPDDLSTCGGGMFLAIRGNVGYNGRCYTQPSSGEWHYLTVVYDKGEPSATEATLYIDGALQAPISQPFSSNNTNNFDNVPFFLSSRGGTLEFNANTMDDVRIYDRALNEDEVNNLFVETSGASDITSGLVGHWKLDDGSGTTAVDSSGNGFDGTLTNGPTWDSGGMIKGDLLFVDDNLTSVNIPYSDTAGALQPTSGITYSLWVYPLSNGGYERIIHRRRDWHDLRLMADGTSRFNLRVNGTTRYPNTGVTVPLNGWHHLVGTYDGSEVAIYLDGVKQGSVAATGSIDTYGTDFAIGRDISMSNNGEAFDGYIDDVRIYNRGLSASEVRQLYFYREHRSTFTPTTCSDPTGNPGDMVFNTTHNVMQYCNGQNWIGIGK